MNTTTDQFVFPDDVRWHDARRAAGLAAGQRPAAIVLPTSVDDVIAAVAYAHERGLAVAVRGSGHGNSHRSLAGTLLIDVRHLRAVEAAAALRHAESARAA